MENEDLVITVVMKSSSLLNMILNNIIGQLLFMNSKIWSSCSQAEGTALKNRISVLMMMC
jgi:hypothetical protein